jgi:hypothetical protein
VIGLFVLEDQAFTRTAAYMARVEQYVQHRTDLIDYSVGVDGPENALHDAWIAAAGLKGVPYAFIIDKKGHVAWFGSPAAPEMDNVLGQVLNDQFDVDAAAAAYKAQINVQLKSNVTYDTTKPLLIGGNGGEDSDFLYRSVLTRSRRAWSADARGQTSVESLDTQPGGGCCAGGGRGGCVVWVAGGVLSHAGRRGGLGADERWLEDHPEYRQFGAGGCD